MAKKTEFTTGTWSVVKGSNACVTQHLKADKPERQSAFPLVGFLIVRGKRHNTLWDKDGKNVSTPDHDLDKLIDPKTDTPGCC